MYNIVMFAYNEEKNISASITSVYDSVSDNLQNFYVIANGCTDKTVETANGIRRKLNFTNLRVVSLEMGDKCNAWNEYIHSIATSSNVHFFVDADVKFSKNCFDLMEKTLCSKEEQTVAVAGLPLSGRNVEFYRSLVFERSCFFGNLYGLRGSFVSRIKEAKFRLPIGLNWIDSFLTKAVNTDIQFFNYNLPNRVTYAEGVGYYFDSLSPFHWADIKLYFKRIARYELGKIQEQYLDALSVNEWPENMRGINRDISDHFEEKSKHLSYFKKLLVKRRLEKLLMD